MGIFYGNYKNKEPQQKMGNELGSYIRASVLGVSVVLV